MSKSPAQLLYDEYLAIQSEHMALWERRLLPALFKEVRTFVLSQNFCADSLTSPDYSQRHRVYRGQDLIEIIQQWPALRPPYKVEEQRRDDSGEDCI